MALEIDPWLTALFGSETRVRTLAPLANAAEPLTAYRVAQLGGVQRIKVYAELRRLAEAGVVAERPTGANRSVWMLSDSEVRRLLQRRARVVRSEDWFLGERRRAQRAKNAATEPTSWFETARYRRNPAVAARYAREIERPSEKDEVAARVGARVSRKRR